LDRERDAKACIADLIPMLEKHGYATFSRAANKLIRDRRDAENIRLLISQKEQELAALKAKNPDVFRETHKKKEPGTGRGIETLVD